MVNYKKEIADILMDKISGSSFLAHRIEKIFPLIPERDFEHTVNKILKTHASMASVINRLNYLCIQKEGKEPLLIRDVSKETFELFWKENRGRKKWITLSLSLWVLELLKYCKEKLNLKIGISYPDKEGLITYEKLKDFHDIEIYEDNKLVSEAEESDGIILGADLIADNFIVNKTGSLSLSLAANYFDKALFIISSGDKYLSDELLPFFKLKTKRSKSVIFHYFEKVPLKLITKIYLTYEPFKLPLSATMKHIKERGYK